MSRSYSTFIAMRYLRSKRKEVFISIITIISVLGVAVSVIVLNMTMSVMTGFETMLQTKLIDANAHITVRGYGGNVRNFVELIEQVKHVPGVKSAYPFINSQAMLTSSTGGARGLIIRGISNDPAAREKLKSVIKNDSVIEKLFAPASLEIIRPDGDPDTVLLPPLVVGQALSDALYLTQQNPVTLFSPDMRSSPQGLVPKLRRFGVVGNYKSGLIEYESGLAYLSLQDAQSFFGLGDAVSGVEVNVTNLFEAPKIAAAIATALETSQERLDVTDWTRQNQPLFEAIKLEKKVYFFVLLLLILIASFSIISTLVMLVMEKGKDIAILKTMGATDRGIQRIFLLQGATIGGAGVLLGTILGWFGCVLLKRYGFPLDEKVFSTSVAPVEMQLSNFVLVAISGFVITALAGIYPARRAARLRPADALRFE